MIRKITIYVSIFAILLCSLIPFNVSASGYEGTVVDLLTAGSYQFRQSTQAWTTISYPGGNSGNYSNVALKWDCASRSDTIKTIFINVRSSANISTLRLSEDDESTIPTATYLGMYDSLYQFKVQLTDYTFSTFSMRIFFGSETNVEFLVESVYGIVQEAIPVTQANHNTYLVYFDYNTNNQGTKPSQMHYEGGLISFPYTMNITREVYPVTGFDWQYQQNILEIYPNNQNLKDIGIVSILIKSNDIHDATVSLNVGGIKEVIPCTLETMLTAQKWPGFNNDFYYWQMNWYELTFDLSSYDLSGSNTCAYIYFDNEAYEYGNAYKYTYNEIVGAWYYPVRQESPWYKTMWTWISSGFDRVVNALTGDPSNGAMQEAADHMQQQAQQMNEVNSVMNNVSRPEINTGEILQNSLDFSPSSLSVLSAFTSNPTISSMLLLVFTFALIGYIFFGKKG